MRPLALDCGGHFKIMVKRKKTIGLGALLLACGALGWFALGAAKPSPQPSPGVPGEGVGTKIDFEKHVQPIFVGACYECHGAKKMKGKLRLDSKQCGMKGVATWLGTCPG